ncbi:MAG TPA: rhodanese-like domain-containing protein [Nitrospirota bacterium]|nr:rhodanese-like domain-containing protein [Nitrospirota bacterium]
MGKKSSMFLYSCIAVCSILLLSSAVLAQQEKPKIAKPCTQCHQPDPNILRGLLGGVSSKAETLSVVIGPATWLVKFDDKTELVGEKSLAKIPRDKEVGISFVEKNGALYAKKVSVKPPAQVPKEKIVTVETVAEHIKKGDAVIIDSRPKGRFNEGHIVNAINIYDAEFDKNLDKLPKDKNKLLIFYCAGVT